MFNKLVPSFEKVVFWWNFRRCESHHSKEMRPNNLLPNLPSFSISCKKLLLLLLLEHELKKHDERDFKEKQHFSLHQIDKKEHCWYFCYFLCVQIYFWIMHFVVLLFLSNNIPPTAFAPWALKASYDPLIHEMSLCYLNMQSSSFLRLSSSSLVYIFIPEF